MGLGLGAGVGLAATVTRPHESQHHLTASQPALSPPAPHVRWDSFGFGLNADTDAMWVQVWREGEGWLPGRLYQRSRLALDPAATVINYGQALFEGLKAYRRNLDGGKETLALFRPELNAQRMNEGCRRLLLPEIDEEGFVTACAATAMANGRWVPPQGKGALYLRPVLFGSGAKLGVGPSREVTLVIYASPVNTYFKNPRPIGLLMQDRYYRATPGGVGGVKYAGNYAPTFAASRLARAGLREAGYDEILYLDARKDTYVEEAGAANFFAVLRPERPKRGLLGFNLYSNHAKDAEPPSPEEEMMRARGSAIPVEGAEEFAGLEVCTPTTDRKTILDGVTRRSLLDIAKYVLGVKAEARDITYEEVMEAEEAFCSGTGAVVTPVGRLRRMRTDADGNESLDPEVQLKHCTTPGPLTMKMREILMGIQEGRLPDVFDWVVDAKQVARAGGVAFPTSFCRATHRGYAYYGGYKSCWPRFSYREL
uniref:Branched-chain-amino-acid aminotransferase n=1 Tax=Phaeomonas parva TaxID=124430 RepID=A0A7S1XVW6_9STRA